MNSNKNTLPSSAYTAETPTVTKQRSSNLELYRILCMVMIVAHHFVVNSGLTDGNGPLSTDPASLKSFYLEIFGAWGKTGINCFLMITGYFMCTSKITLRKFAKLMGQIYLYDFIFFLIFCYAGFESLSPKRIFILVMPVWCFGDNFISCFIGFWLTIPFLNILVNNMTKRQHELLLLLTLTMYTLLSSIPGFNVAFNYATWFVIIYFIASYIRLYPNAMLEKRKLWGWLTVILLLVTVLSFRIMRALIGYSYFFVVDCNKFFAVAIAVSSFLWFKNMNIKYSNVINAFGAGTFGVLLIHANSDAMRQWLWKDTMDVVGHYSLPFGQLVLFSVGTVLAIFVICNLIDQLRIATLEKWLFRWYDNSNYIKRISSRIESIQY